MTDYLKTYNVKAPSAGTNVHTAKQSGTQAHTLSGSDLLQSFFRSPSSAPQQVKGLVIGPSKGKPRGRPNRGFDALVGADVRKVKRK
jgi:hypothetical protein